MNDEKATNNEKKSKTSAPFKMEFTIVPADFFKEFDAYDPYISRSELSSKLYDAEDVLGEKIRDVARAKLTYFYNKYNSKYDEGIKDDLQFFADDFKLSKKEFIEKNMYNLGVSSVINHLLKQFDKKSVFKAIEEFLNYHISQRYMGHSRIQINISKEEDDKHYWYVIEFKLD